MKVCARRLLFGLLALFLLTTACNLPAQSTTAPVGTILPEEQATSTFLPTLPTSTIGSSNETPTISIPVTGLEEVTLVCQFCVNEEPHAVVMIHQSASFTVANPSTRINCITAQLVGERRILFCRGAQQASFSLNVCADSSSCVQLPVTLETCPLIPQTGLGTPWATLPSRTPVVLTAVSTSTPITLPTSTAASIPTQTVFAPPPATATAVPPLQPTATLPAVGRPPRSAGLNDPEGFARWYFNAVWRERNYQDLWDNYLTPSFKARTGSGTYDDYVAWWSSVERVDVHSVNVIENDGSRAWIRVNVTFTMKDGRVIANQEYDYDLLYDPTRQTWMFDFRA